VFIRLVLALSLSTAMLPLAMGQSQQAQPPDPTGQSPASPAPTTPPTFPPNTKEQPEAESPSAAGSAGSPADSSMADNFPGTIVSRKGELVLRNGDQEYKLDNQNEATRYKGKKVKVTGSLDRQSNTIHVQKIEPQSPTS
jgi:hypothetical protein